MNVLLKLSQEEHEALSKAKLGYAASVGKEVKWERFVLDNCLKTFVNLSSGGGSSSASPVGSEELYRNCLECNLRFFPDGDEEKCGNCVEPRDPNVCMDCKGDSSGMPRCKTCYGKFIASKTGGGSV